MKRDEVLSTVANVARTNQAFVFAGNGYNARALHALADQPDFFYMVGSMGLCSTLAAGFSHSTKTPVVAIEGDGNALMGMSGFAVAVNAAQGPFVHIVLDNALYESTGRQRTLSPQIDFMQIALGAGYDQVYHPGDVEELASLLEAALQCTARTFIYVSTEVSADITHPRVPHHPRQIAQRFCEACISQLHFSSRNKTI